MSSFLVSTETMQRVVTAIDRARFNSFNGMPTDTPKDLDTIGRALFAMNVSALDQRYPIDRHHASTFNYRPLGDVSKAEQYYAISCLIYQCSEGNVPDTDLYKALDKFRDRLAHEIAGQVAQNAKLPWDWPEMEQPISPSAAAYKIANNFNGRWADGILQHIKENP